MTYDEILEALERLDKGVVVLSDEITRLRSALQFIANHEAPEGSALATVVRFAKLAIEVKE